MPVQTSAFLCNSMELNPLETSISSACQEIPRILQELNGS
jgi:hypothetical protein